MIRHWADIENRARANAVRGRVPRWPVLPQPSGRAAALHRRLSMVSQVLHEHAASLSAASHANRSRRPIKCAKDSGHYPYPPMRVKPTVRLQSLLDKNWGQRTTSPPGIVLVQPVSQSLVFAGRLRSIVIPPRLPVSVPRPARLSRLPMWPAPAIAGIANGWLEPASDRFGAWLGKSRYSAVRVPQKNRAPAAVSKLLRAHSAVMSFLKRDLTY